jgi:hypothetical protein
MPLLIVSSYSKTRRRSILNPIEMLWRHIRRLVTHNYRFDALAAVMEAVRLALEELSKQTEQVLSIIGGKPLTNAEAT